MNRFNRLLLALLAAVAGFAGWQSYRLHREREVRNDHLAHSASLAAYFLNTSAQTIADMDKNNRWDDPDTRSSFTIWLAYTQQAVTDANATLQDYQQLRSSETAMSMNDIFFWYMDWRESLGDALRNSTPMAAEDKAKLSQLSRIVSQVKDFYTGNYSDKDELFAKLDNLHDVWLKELEMK